MGASRRRIPGRRAACRDPDRTLRTPRRARGPPVARGRPRRGCAGRSPLAGVGERGRLGQGLQDGSDLVAGEGEERPLVQDEVEQHRQTVAVTEVLDELFGLDVGLGQDDGITPSPGDLVVQVVQPGEVLARGGVTGHRELDDEGGGVEPEPRHAQLQPEPDDLLDLLTHPQVGHVQVGLEVVEAVVVPGPGRVVERPGRVLIAGEHGALSQVARLLLGPDVPIPIRRGRVGASRLEPRVLIGGVVDDEIDDDADASVVGLVDQLDKVAQRAQMRVDSVEVGDVVAVVPIRARDGWGSARCR